MRNERRPMWGLWLPLIPILVAVLLVPGQWLDGVVRAEDAMVAEGMSGEFYERIHASADEWQRDLTRDTGVGPKVIEWIFPNGDASRRPHVLEGFGKGRGTKWLEARGQAMQTYLYLVLLRMAMIAAWWPCFVLITVPAAWDGLMQWKVRQSDFTYASPLIHRTAFLALYLIFFILLIALFAPAPIPPVVFPVAIMVLVIASIITLAANMPKSV